MTTMRSVSHASRAVVSALVLTAAVASGCTVGSAMPPRTTAVGQTHAPKLPSHHAEASRPEGAESTASPVVSTPASSYGSNAAPPPAWARGFLVYERETVIHRMPSDQSERVGTTHAQVVLPFRGRHLGPGCGEAWVAIEPQGYVCGDDGEFTRTEPHARSDAPNTPMPFEFAFVAVDGARAFADVRYWGMDEYAEAYGEGFALRITGYTTHEGVRFARLRNGLFMEAAMLRMARPSSFKGHAFTPPRKDAALRAQKMAGWTRRERTLLRDRVGGTVVARLPARTFATVKDDHGRYLTVTLQDGREGVVAESDLHLVVTASRPAGVAADERWIDVDLQEQVLTAYEGDSLIFATLVSTGRPSAQSRTPTGTFRIWVKLDFSDMDDLERIDVESNYAMQDVPWVQFFEKGHGLHAVYWHDRFGEPRSHGCVNLAPADALYLFRLTEPSLPTGWHAILPNDELPGTVIRVR